MSFWPGWPFRRPIDPRVLEEYRRHHPTPATRADIAAFPKMIPTSVEHTNGQYILDIEQTLATWDIPVLVMFSDGDMAFKPEEGECIAAMVPNGRFQLVRDAGHYLHEDAGEEIAERMATFLRDEAQVTGG